MNDHDYAQDPTANGESPLPPAYATRQTFGGQRASVGRIVLICVRGTFNERCLHAGVIASINQDDFPRISDMQIRDFPPQTMHFVHTSNEADANALPIGAWTWLPRV